MGLFDKFKTQTETKVLNQDNYMSNIQEINSELEHIVSKCCMGNGQLSWHKVRNHVNSNFRADEICFKANHELGIPIIYNNQVFQDWSM